MTTWIIPEGIAEITEEYVRDNMPMGISEVLIPESVNSIGSYAFRPYGFNGCTNLEKIVIPNGVKTIGIHAFSGLSSLNLIVLPDALVNNRLDYGITPDQTVFSCHYWEQSYSAVKP